jgi:hypothetical protein
LIETECSEVNYLENVVGQYVTYVATIDFIGSNFPLYLTVPRTAYEQGILSEPIGQLTVQQASIKLLIIDMEQEVIHQWKI